MAEPAALQREDSSSSDAEGSASAEEDFHSAEEDWASAEEGPSLDDASEDGVGVYAEDEEA